VLDLLQQVPVGIIWQTLTACALLVLAFQFGRTLFTGQVPLIEKIARVSRPDLPEILCRYTRHLTLLWFVYLVAAALFLLSEGVAQPIKAASVGFTTMILFAGEHCLRKYLFPEESFPSLFQQVSDTVASFKRHKS
jgi:uncharacterized membrane protein